MEEQRIRWVGVDCGEQQHRAVVLDSTGEGGERFWVVNRREKIHQWVVELRTAYPHERLRLVVESRRSVGSVLAQEVVALGLELWTVWPKALKDYRSLEGQPRKDDDRDAYLLARMGWNAVSACRPAVIPRAEEVELCRLTRLHERITREKTRMLQQLRSCLLELAPEMLAPDWEGPRWQSVRLRRVLRRWPTLEGLERARRSTVEAALKGGPQAERTQEVEALRTCARQIRQSAAERAIVALEMSYLVDQIERLAAILWQLDEKIRSALRHHPLGSKLQEMPGYGPFTAGVEIGEALPLMRHADEGKVATYAGLTPLVRQSGKRGRSHLARGVNRHLLRARYMAALGACKTSTLDRAYYERKRQDFEGHPKPHVKARLALARQRSKVVYKLLTTDVSYDKEILIRAHFERRQLQEQRAKAA